jgi:ABC-type nitrate/sulfonate/bicarbonate transport system ATPase subunit
VLSELTFSLRSGEVAGLVGPSGCGKTTLLRIVAGLDRDFDGNVAFPAHGPLAMVFQEPRLLPWRTVEQNVRLAAPRATGASLEMLFQTLGLKAHRDHYPRELSLGLARRVALARAFAVEPDLLLLDEPFVSLDDALAARLREELAELVNRRPVTTLLVTHNAMRQSNSPTGCFCCRSVLHGSSPMFRSHARGRRARRRNSQPCATRSHGGSISRFPRQISDVVAGRAFCPPRA